MQDLLRAAYAANILILLAVVVSLFRARASEPLAAFGNRATADRPVTLLVASLWTGIMICSGFGLFVREAFIGLLVFQVVYKATYLAVFAGPAYLRGDRSSLPIGVISVFAIIVLAWPPLIWFAWFQGAQM